MLVFVALIVIAFAAIGLRALRSSRAIQRSMERNVQRFAKGC